MQSACYPTAEHVLTWNTPAQTTYCKTCSERLPGALSLFFSLSNVKSFKGGIFVTLYVKKLKGLINTTYSSVKLILWLVQIFLLWKFHKTQKLDFLLQTTEEHKNTKVSNT